MIKKPSGLAPLVVACLSLPCVAIGAFLREHSSRFDEWSSEYMAGADPAHGIALMSASWWPMVTFFWFIGFAVFLIAFAVMGWAFRHTKLQVLRVLLMLVFILPTAFVAKEIMPDFLRDFRLGFYFMAFGECLTVMALFLGIWQMTTSWWVDTKKPA
ncbi:MAG TPA: hypothetical protein VNW30_01685 [Opitutaceae bacterium]|jgi:hypothetical protein|nr:hypothetical protein [Opitutaceae bacterium]